MADSASASPPIPRVVHALWLQGEADLRARKPDLAQILDHNRAHAAAASPPWQLRVWSEEDALRDAWPKLDPALRERLEPVLESCPSHAARSDVLRLVVLAAEGGVYIDTDMMLLRDAFGWALQDCSLALAHDTNMTRADAWLFGSRGSNCFLGAAQGHPFVLEALQQIAAAEPYPRATFPDMSAAARKWTLRTTGPELLQRLLASPEWWERAAAHDGGIRLLPGAIVQMQREGTSPADWVDPATPMERRASALEASVLRANPSAIMVHFSDNSWVSNKLVSMKRAGLAVRNWGYQNWVFVEVLFALALAALLVGAIVLVRWVSRSQEQRIASLRRRLRRALAARKG